MRPDEERRTRLLLDSMLWVDVDADLAELAAQLARPYVRSHPGIETVDLLLAAATVRLGARLLTRNTRHFPMLEGLKAPYE
jgi:predicted nucleic acid-binding protein